MKLSRPVDFLKRLPLSIASSFDRADLPVIFLFLGLALIGYGASQIHRGFGSVLVGLLIVFYVKPLSRWVK